MSYDIPLGSHRITLGRAYEMVARYQENMDKILNPNLEAEHVLAKSETFRKDALIDYLSKDMVHYVRIYYGMSENMQVHAIIVGADKDGNDILPKPIVPGQPPTGEDDGELFEEAVRCPTACPPPGWPGLASKM